MSTRMIHVPIDLTALGQWAGRRGLMRKGVFDEGFVMHMLLAATFGKSVVQPYRVATSRNATVSNLYGYCPMSSEALRDLAQTVAPPDCLRIMKLSELACKLMPQRFRPGQRLGFDIRVRPVRRLGNNLQDTQSRQVLRKGSEVDAFRLELLHRFPGGWQKPRVAQEHSLTRESVYASWLGERLDGAAQVDTEASRLVSFRRTRAWRGKGRVSEGPDATLQGELVVSDQERFAARIQGGVGRHKAYGYGMLILRPPRRVKRRRTSES